MTYVIIPTRVGAQIAWEVSRLIELRGVEVRQPITSFGYRPHAEAFLADLMSQEGARARRGRAQFIAPRPGFLAAAALV
jgi:hypothetical protein